MSKSVEPLAYSVRSAAVALRVSRKLLTDAVRDGQLKCFRAGVRAIILKSDLEKFVRSLPEYRGGRYCNAKEKRS